MFSVVFSGYLTKDASFGTYGDNSVLNFTVAVHYPTNKKTEQGQPIRETEFFNCSRWYKGNDFSNLLNYLKKGQRVLIVGNKMQTLENEKDGTKYFNIHINVQSIELIGSGGATRQEEPERGAEIPTPNVQRSNVPDLEDDLPF